MTISLMRFGALIRRLLRNDAGNTLIITAFLLFPMIAMIGSGIDMSRAYMVKTRLQAACDSGVLAGRRAMSDGDYSTAAEAKANTMFNFNFPAEDLAVDAVVFDTQAGDGGQVVGTATGTLPTLVMHMFNFEDFDLAVDCSAELQIANADIMFVLDTTGSMLDCADGSACNGNASSKIQGLRDAVIDFHETISEAVTADADTRIRYGFVPYSSATNVSGLMASNLFPTSYLANNQAYQTRLALYDTPIYTVTSTTNVGAATKQAYNNGNTSITAGQCTAYATNNYPSSGNNPVIISGSKPGTVRERTYSNPEHGYSGAPDSSGNSRSCRRTYQDRDVTYASGGFSHTGWRFIQDTLSISDLKDGTATIATGTAGTVTTAGYYDPVELLTAPGAAGIIQTTSTWGGCIEERATVNQLDMSPVPVGATDLDINSAPNSEATRWKPIWDDVAYYRGTSYPTVRNTTGTSSPYNSFDANCPSPMREFVTVDTTSVIPPSWLTTYLTNLVAVGNTYHDIGMIWGGRLGSPRGIMAANVENGEVDSVSRHVIFMTDGQMAPSRQTYSSYGFELHDNRVAPSGTSNSSSTPLIPYHNARFLAACDAVKAEGYTVWVVGFGTTLTTELTQCSSDGRAYYASNTAALLTAFTFIASQIADLRLNQ